MKNKKLKMLIRTCSILTSIAVFTVFATSSYAEDSVESLEGTTSNLQNELSDLNSELDALSGELDTSSFRRLRSYSLTALINSALFKNSLMLAEENSISK